MSDSAAPASRRGVLDALKTMNVQDLTAVIDAAEAARAEKMEDAKRTLVAEFREKASGLGLSPEDFESLFHAAPAAPSRKKRASGDKVAVKYRGPNGEEWSGRGRQPNWLAALEATGRKREEFAVQ